MAMLTIVSACPIPIRWRSVRGLLVSLSQRGKSRRSMMKMKTEVEINMKTGTEPAGILKRGPMRRSMVKAWMIAKLSWMAKGVHKNKPVDHNGNILTRLLRSSTCSTVLSSHGFATEPSCFVSPSVLSAARFKNLPKSSPKRGVCCNFAI